MKSSKLHIQITYVSLWRFVSISLKKKNKNQTQVIPDLENVVVNTFKFYGVSLWVWVSVLENGMLDISSFSIRNLYTSASTVKETGLASKRKTVVIVGGFFFIQ